MIIYEIIDFRRFFHDSPTFLPISQKVHVNQANFENFISDS